MMEDTYSLSHIIMAVYAESVYRYAREVMKHYPSVVWC